MSESAVLNADITVSDAGPCLKRVAVAVPAAEVDARLSESLDAVTAQAALPGFRPGRVPRRLVEKRFGEALKSEARNAIVQAAMEKAVADHKLKVLGNPSSDDLKDAELKAGQAFKFSMDVEVLPDFVLPGLEGIAVKRPAITVPDAMIEDEVKKICINEGDLEERQSPEAGDYLTGKGVMVDDAGTKHYDIDGAVVRVPLPEDKGRGMILGVMVEDFAKQLGLPKAGQTATIRVKGPENHEVEALRGKSLTITFDVARCDRIIPASIDAVVAKFGFESADKLRELVAARLQQRARVRQQIVQHQQIAKHLLDSTTMQLPAKLTASQAQRALDRRRFELMYRGVDPAKIEEHIAELRAASAAQASRDLKLFFILSQAAEALNVQVTQQEVNAQITRLAMERGEKPQKFFEELQRNNRLSMLVQQVRDHKVLDAVLSKASVDEVSEDDFRKYAKDLADAEKA
jgi:trigger factor